MASAKPPTTIEIFWPTFQVLFNLAMARRPRSRVDSPNIIARASRQSSNCGFCVSRIARSYLGWRALTPKLGRRVTQKWDFLRKKISKILARKIFWKRSKKVSHLGATIPAVMLPGVGNVPGTRFRRVETSIRHISPPLGPNSKMAQKCSFWALLAPLSDLYRHKYRHLGHI